MKTRIEKHGITVPSEGHAVDHIRLPIVTLPENDASQHLSCESALIECRELLPSQRIGLLPWFLEQNYAIQKICKAAYGAVWINNVEQRFAILSGNKSGRPTSWHALGKAVRRDPKGFTQYAHSGKTDQFRHRQPRIPETELRYRVAWALGCHEDDLSPDVSSWIASATRLLMLHFEPMRSNEINSFSLDAYSEYLCANFGSHDDFLKADAIATVHRSLSCRMALDKIINDILKVAELVGIIVSRQFKSKSV